MEVIGRMMARAGASIPTLTHVPEWNNYGWLLVLTKNFIINIACKVQCPAMLPPTVNARGKIDNGLRAV